MNDKLPTREELLRTLAICEKAKGPWPHEGARQCDLHEWHSHATETLPAYAREILRLQAHLEFFTKHYHCRECKVPWSPELHDAICSEDGDSYSDHPTRHGWYSKREGEMCDKMLAAEQRVAKQERQSAIDLTAARSLGHASGDSVGDCLVVGAARHRAELAQLRTERDGLRKIAVDAIGVLRLVFTYRLTEVTIRTVNDFLKSVKCIRQLMTDDEICAALAAAEPAGEEGGAK